MNQILIVENKKSKSGSGPMEIKLVVRIFTIVIILFGLAFIGKGSYAIYKESKGKDTRNMPVVSIDRINDKVSININGVNTISKLKYRWNNSEETIIPVESTYAEESDILLPNEDSVLNVIVEEENGRTIKYSKTFIIQGIDIIQPKIDITEGSTVGSIKITATDETAISHITYKINDGEEVKIDKSGLEEKTMNYIVTLPRGENMVTVTATDEEGNTEVIEKKIIVSGKTTINLNIENGKLIILVQDPDGVRDIEINLNGVEYSKKNINQKSLKIAIDLIEGTNTIKITATNVNSITTTGAKEFNYAQ